VHKLEPVSPLRQDMIGPATTLVITAGVYSPAGLSLLRLIGTVPLALLSLRRRTYAWCALAILLILGDLADGIIARRIDDPAATRMQRRCDHLADAAMHVALPTSALWLDPALPREERGYMFVLVAAQAISTLACLLKFGCLPRYRTQSYRWASGTVGVALAARIAERRLSGVFHTAVLMLALSHFEALLITCRIEVFRQPIDGIWSTEDMAGHSESSGSGKHIGSGTR
jgi:phosphatidylglycerophosphate synthase